MTGNDSHGRSTSIMHTTAVSHPRLVGRHRHLMRVTHPAAIDHMSPRRCGPCRRDASACSPTLAMVSFAVSRLKPALQLAGTFLRTGLASRLVQRQLRDRRLIACPLLVSSFGLNVFTA